MKNLLDKKLTETEDVLAKGLNFAVTLEEVPVFDPITRRLPLQINKSSEAEAEQIRLKVSAVLSNFKTPASDTTTQVLLLAGSHQNATSAGLQPYRMPVRKNIKCDHLYCF